MAHGGTASDGTQHKGKDATGGRQKDATAPAREQPAHIKATSAPPQ